MEIWKKVQLKQLASASKLEIAYSIALQFFNNLGYEYCAFSMTSHAPATHLNPVHLNNYPHDWNIQYEQNHYSSIDPIVAHCNRSTLPILWDSHSFATTPELWHALEDQGLQHGWSQPVHEPRGAAVGMLSVARSHCRVTAFELYEQLGYSVFICQKLQTLALQLTPGTHPECDNQTHLSPREIEVLKWSAHGKTASDVATILSLSERTVNFHVNSAIKKMGVANKMSAVVAAVKSRMI
ncbi:autoinducer binding domain-containing protein [Pseudomonas fluorescens]|uniref:autoinducer binding domain-containing protein n=1 Tax=Pseudomonas fluorescens TaxID=294 RepID=UPI003F97ECA1